MTIKANLLTFLMLAALPVKLIASDAPKPPVAPLFKNVQQEPNNSKKNWMLNIEQTLPGLLCDNKHYFITCFETTQHDCVEFTHLLVHACLNNVALALPEHLDKAQGEHWGQMIGKCSYDLYEKFMQNKKKKSATCQNTPNPKKAPSPPTPAK